MANKLFIVAVIIIGLGYTLYVPIPDGYSLESSLWIRLFLAAGKLGMFLGGVSEKLGLASTMSFMKRMSQESPSTNMSEYGLQAVDELFDGVPVRIYRPINQKKTLPGFVYYHGGGWTILNVNAYDQAVAGLARSINAVVVSVEYRTAPDHVFPAAFDDCVAATKHFIKNAKKYNIDPSRVAVGGDSAGGNLAATVSLKLRDDNFEPRLKLQVLIYPVVQALDMDLPSYRTYNDGPLLTRHLMSAFDAVYTSKEEYTAVFASNRHAPDSVRLELAKTHLNLDRLPKKYTQNYARQPVKDADEKVWKEIKSVMLNPYFAPLFAKNLEGLPMAYIFSCQHDVLRDEAFLYAHRLREAGNQVEHYMFDNGFHGLITLGASFPEFVEHLNHMYDFIKKTL